MAGSYIEDLKRRVRIMDRLDDIERDIALIHLGMAMLLGLSAGAFVISLLGAVA